MEPASGPPSPLAHLHALVVDDHAASRRLVADVLRAAGAAEVSTAESGAEALGLLRIRRPGMIITDQRMPGMEGSELVRIVRRAAVTPDPRVPDPRLPIIVLSGDRTQRDVNAARAAGADAFLMKPFTPARVIERVLSVTRRQVDFVISGSYVGPDRRLQREERYGGPLRRRSDASEILDREARDRFCAELLQELATFTRLVVAREGLDRMLRQMALRVTHAIRQRARELGDRNIERACASLDRYVSAVGGAGPADPEVVEIHLDTLRALASLPAEDLKGAALVVRQLDKAVSRRIASHLAMLAA